METGETIKKGFLRLERDAQNIPGGFHCCAEDPENGYPFAYVSDRFLEILGWEREEFAARFDNRYTALIHPDDLAAGLATGMRKTARLTPRMVTASSGFWAKTATAGSPTLPTGWNGTAAAISWALSRISPPMWNCGKSWNSINEKSVFRNASSPERGSFFVSAGQRLRVISPARHSKLSRAAKKPPHKKCSGFAGCHITASAQR